MLQNQNSNLYKGSGSLTREQFLFHETRTVAKLMIEGLTDDAIIEKLIRDNLFQYPTEKSIKKVATGCIRRLNDLSDNTLIRLIAERPSDVSKQVCLFAMMKHYRIVWEFMITVIGEKYRSMDFSFGKIDINTFFMRLQEQDDFVASWSDETIKKIKSVLLNILVENGYLDSNKSNVLNPVLIDRELENSIRSNNDDIALPAFNCFS